MPCPSVDGRLWRLWRLWHAKNRDCVISDSSRSCCCCFMFDNSCWKCSACATRSAPSQSATAAVDLVGTCVLRMSNYRWHPTASDHPQSKLQQGRSSAHRVHPWLKYWGMLSSGKSPSAIDLRWALSPFGLSTLCRNRCTSCCSACFDIRGSQS